VYPATQGECGDTTVTEIRKLYRSGHNTVLGLSEDMLDTLGVERGDKVFVRHGGEEIVIEAANLPEDAEIDIDDL